MLKFGGTSVSAAANWHNIASVVRSRIRASFRPVIVHSALSGITDRLESLLASAVEGTHSGELEQIDAAHRRLAQALVITPSPMFEGFMRELRDLAHAAASGGAALRCGSWRLPRNYKLPVNFSMSVITVSVQVDITRDTMPRS